jgi:MoaA/NifB/PqqE/SkfB family radical SAM enzyme
MRLINHPVLCNYYLTYRCNAKCGFCDIWEKPSPYATLETIEENLKALKKLGVSVIDFTGGEPLLHKELDQVLGMAKNMGFVTTVTTNGLLYPKWADRIAGKVDMLHFSLDYYDKEKHNEARGVDCYDHVMESIVIAKSLGERPDILFTVFEENVDEIDPVYRNICLPNNLMLLLNPVFDYNQVDAGPSLSEFTLDTLEKWVDKPMIYLNRAFIQLRRDGGNKTTDPICKAGSSTIVLSPENKLVLPCYHLGIKEIDINANLDELYRSEEVQKLIALEGRLPECEGCTINCYMQPSFAVELNKYWFKAISSTFKYNLRKGTWKAAFGI